MSKNLHSYTQGKLTASEKRVLLTKWVGAAWQEMNRCKDTTVRSFKKCGISLDLNDMEIDAVNIEGVPDYKMPSVGEVPEDDVEFHLESEDDSDDEFQAGSLSNGSTEVDTITM